MKSAPPLPIATSYNDGEYGDNNDEYDDDVDNNDVFPDKDLYRQRCCARHPASWVYATSPCLPYGSEVVLRFQNTRVLTSLAVHPNRGRGGGGIRRRRQRRRLDHRQS